jgi:hypothetical protein
MRKYLPRYTRRMDFYSRDTQVAASRMADTGWDDGRLGSVASLIPRGTLDPVTYSCFSPR